MLSQEYLKAHVGLFLVSLGHSPFSGSFMLSGPGVGQIDAIYFLPPLVNRHQLYMCPGCQDGKVGHLQDIQILSGSAVLCQQHAGKSATSLHWLTDAVLTCLGVIVVWASSLLILLAVHSLILSRIYATWLAATDACHAWVMGDRCFFFAGHATFLQSFAVCDVLMNS